mmetsp:Transcript_39636/g.157606  ORF Transcript_39636/g.157606 Transcript_39636/m.157606 type:complete len:133 (-) Transcript_39636:1516-1914(-)
MDLESRISYAKFMDALYRDDREEIVKLYGNELGFVSKYSDPDVMYRRACFFHDRDSDDVTEGLNIQLFMEEMDRRDPVISMADEFIMVGRLSFLMRGLGNAFNISLRISEYWYPFARGLLDELQSVQTISTN